MAGGNDRETAGELRRQVKAAGGARRVRAADLAASFGRPELRGEPREAIARALGEAGLRADPRLDREDPEAEDVALSVRRARFWRPDPDRALPAWVLALLGIVAVGLGAGAALLLQGGERTTTRTIRETVTTDRRGAERTVTERDVRTVTVTETTTTTVFTTADPPAPEPPEAP